MRFIVVFLPLLLAAQSTPPAATLGGPGGVISGANGPDENLPPPPQGPTPRTADGKPDFSGVWLSGNYNFSNMGQVPLQPWAEEVYRRRREDNGKDDPEARCLPTGVPRITPYPFKLVQLPKLIVMLFEGNIMSYRQFFLDRKHPEELDKTWMGESVAHWDGDTLVVDTQGLNDKTWLNGRGMPHTDQLHVIERYRRPDLGHLEVDITMEDPGAFTKPHSFRRTHVLSADWEIHEYVCNEFNIDVEHMVGK
jgi:hypothetical protein